MRLFGGAFVAVAAFASGTAAQLNPFGLLPTFLQPFPVIRPTSIPSVTSVSQSSGLLPSLSSSPSSATSHVYVSSSQSSSSRPSMTAPPSTSSILSKSVSSSLQGAPQQPGPLPPGPLHSSPLQPGLLQPGTQQPGTQQPGSLQPGPLPPAPLQPVPPPPVRGSSSSVGTFVTLSVNVLSMSLLSMQSVQSVQSKLAGLYSQQNAAESTMPRGSLQSVLDSIASRNLAPRPTGQTVPLVPVPTSIPQIVQSHLSFPSSLFPLETSVASILGPAVPTATLQSVIVQYLAERTGTALPAPTNPIESAISKALQGTSRTTSAQSHGVSSAASTNLPLLSSLQLGESS